MFHFFQSRKKVITEGGQSAEAIANNDPAQALVEAGSYSKTNQKAPSPRNGHAKPPPKVEAKPLSTPNPDRKISRETLTALNVKVICDLAGLQPDKAKI